MPPRRKSSTGKAKGKSGCVLCKRSNEDELDFGGLHSTKNLQAHHFCLLLSESIRQSGEDHQGIWGFLNADITKEVEGSRKKQCHYCDESGATLGCNRKNCKRKFHLPCGLMNRTQHDYEKFISYCHAHRKATNIPAKLKQNIGDYKCVICLETYNPRRTNLEHLVWADCCKKDVILHIACVKRLALSAGYFTKCPACNNNQEFISTVKKFGVFVPERDASWEFDRNAFGDLLYRHDTCDIDTCICPKGRNYKNGSGIWKLILCELCGSVGSHRGCSSIKEDIFICKTCSKITGSSNENTSDTDIATPSESTGQSTTVVPLISSIDDNVSDDEQLSNNAYELDQDVICLSSDSDDHFSEREPDSPPPPGNVPQYSMNQGSRKRKLTDKSATSRQVAKKKTVFLQRIPKCEPQVAKKSTSGNQIYCNFWPRKIEQKSDDETTGPDNTVKYSNLTNKVKNENSEAVNMKPANIESNVSYNNSQSEDSKNISSIKKIINSSLEKTNCFQIFCAGPLILQCSPEMDAVEIGNNNEVEIVNLPDGVTQKNIPLVNPKCEDPIVIIDSDDDNEGLSEIKITEVFSISDSDEESGSNSKGEERLSSSGIFENRIRSTTKDFLKCSRSQPNFKYFKRMKKVVKIDFKPIDSNESQWCRPQMPR